MDNKLWFNQSGETYNGISCDNIYGGCPQDNAGNFIVDRGVIPMGTPVASGLPAPGATQQEIANDVGYVLPPVPTPTPPYTGGIKPIRLLAGQRVGMVSYMACLVPPCPMSANMIKGTVTGDIQKTYPERYEILWDNGTTGFFASSELTVLNEPQITTSPVEPEPVPVVVVPPVVYDEGSYPVVESSGCGNDQYTIPFKVQGEEKCIDKTIALVLGAVAIYLIMKK
jgi:hypothetical protein